MSPKSLNELLNRYTALPPYYLKIIGWADKLGDGCGNPLRGRCKIFEEPQLTRNSKFRTFFWWINPPIYIYTVGGGIVLGLEVHNWDAGRAFFYHFSLHTNRIDSNLWKQLRLVCHNCSNLWQSPDLSVTNVQIWGTEYSTNQSLATDLSNCDRPIRVVSTDLSQSCQWNI